MQNISTHIKYSEAIKSDIATRLGIKNVPNNQQLQAMTLLANKIFEPLRMRINAPIVITSFFRCSEINWLVGGSPNSQHIRGEAMDIKAPRGERYSNADMFYYILNNLEFDQLIWEFGDTINPAWIHVSYSNNKNRKQILRTIKQNEKTLYEAFKPHLNQP